MHRPSECTWYMSRELSDVVVPGDVAGMASIENAALEEYKLFVKLGQLL